MADVVQLNPKNSEARTPETEFVWTCAECGGQSFQLLSTGVTCCCRCAYRSDDTLTSSMTDTHWRSHLPDLPLNMADVPSLSIENVITDHKPTPLILRDFSKHLIKEDPVAVLIVQREGGMRMWSEGCANEEQRAWFEERIASFAKFLLRLDAEAPDGEG